MEWGRPRGVQLFFRLSGLLICSILFRDKRLSGGLIKARSLGLGR
jgi:peptidoglycan/LPS O-acetylase OafA/YrhL